MLQAIKSNTVLSMVQGRHFEQDDTMSIGKLFCHAACFVCGKPGPAFNLACCRAGSVGGLTSSCFAAAPAGGISPGSSPGKRRGLHDPLSRQTQS